MALPILPTIPTIACLSRISVIMDSTERVKLRQFCSLPVSIAAIFCAIPSKVCVAALFTCDILSVALSSHSLQPDFRPAIQLPRSWSSAAQVFFCSDMTLFSASGLSPYCSFRRCSVASRSACRSVSPRAFALIAACFALCCCSNRAACCASSFSRFWCSILSPSSASWRLYSSVSFSWASRDFSCSDNCRFVAASFRTTY